MLVRMWRKGNPFALLVGMQIDAATVESSVEFPQKKFKKWNSLMIQWFHFWEFNPKKSKTLMQKNISTPMYIAALFTVVKFGKQPKCPSVDE